MDPQIRADFPVTSELLYLDTAYISPTPASVLRVGEDFLERRARGTLGRVPDWMGRMEEVRGMVASLIGARPSEIAFTTNTSQGTNIVASSLRLEPGDNVVWDDLDYPSNRVVWQHQLATRGVENRVVNSNQGAATVADFARLVDRRTRVISVSHVSHRNGYRHDLGGLSDLAHAHGGYLHVDGIQSVGAVQVDVKAERIDFLTCGTYKWLLGPLGLAFFYVREELLTELQAPLQGWMQVKTWADESHLRALELHRSARKLESATLHFQGVYELGEALDYINRIGMARIEEQVLRLSSRLWQGLAGLGFELFTPPGTRSGIVTCRIEDGDRIAKLLSSNRVVTTVRENEMRFSPHFFNTEDEIDTLIDLVRSAC